MARIHRHRLLSLSSGTALHARSGSGLCEEAQSCRKARKSPALGRTRPGTRIADIRKQIARNYRIPDLNSEAIGERLGMSARSIQHTLSQHGSTFSKELMGVRLEAAFGMLRSGAAHPIADIAFKCGFSDLSTFYRAFRTRYGKTPNASRVTK